MIDIKVPMRISLWSGTGTVIVEPGTCFDDDMASLLADLLKAMLAADRTYLTSTQGAHHTATFTRVTSTSSCSRSRTSLGEAVSKNNSSARSGWHALLLSYRPGWPHDGRLRDSDIVNTYRQIGDKLKLNFKNCTAWILSGHIEAMKNVGLRPSARKKLLNGSIPSLFCKYEMYQGSKKQKWADKYGQV